MAKDEPVKFKTVREDKELENAGFKSPKIARSVHMNLKKKGATRGEEKRKGPEKKKGEGLKSSRKWSHGPLSGTG